MHAKIKRHYLYSITNTINGKVYIGQTVDPSARWSDHRSSAKNPKVSIQYAIHKYGSENFIFEIISSGIRICACKPHDRGLCQDDANELETLLVTQYDSHISTGKGYNETYGGMNAPRPPMSEATKHKISAAKKGKKIPEEQVKRQIIGIKKWYATHPNPNKGKIASEQTRKKQSESLKAYYKVNKHHGIGISPSDNTKIKLQQATLKWLENNKPNRLGTTITIEHKQAISKASIGNKYALNNKGNIGRKHTAQARANMSVSHMGQKPGNKRIFTDVETKTILSMTIDEATKRYNCSSRVIKRIRKEENGQRKKIIFTEEQIADILSMTILEAADKYKCSAKPIKRIRKEHKKH